MICQAPIRWGRLNAFQKVMLQWSELHPYNATHTYKIAGQARQPDFLDALRETYLTHGLGMAHLSPDGQSYRHQADLDPQITFVSAGEDVEKSVADQSGRELNRPFERPSDRPFRFTLIDAGTQAHYVTLAYDHWTADSCAARLLLQGVLGRYLKRATVEDNQPLELYPGTYREVFPSRLSGLRLAGSAARAVGQWGLNRAAWQVACWSNTQWAVDYRLYHTIPGTVPRLREFARSLGATVHDVLLAALGRAMARVMPSRGRERGLALGSIVDTRGLAEEDLSRTFGAFLGSYLVRNRPDTTAGLDQTVREIAALTRPIKERQSHLDSLVNMKLINAIWPWLSPSVKPHFMRKAMPMTAGISNVVVREAWMDRNRDMILDYSRGAPTGPMLPLVMSPTTFGEHLNVGVTYRMAGFTRAKIDAVMELFLQQIEHPNKASRGELPPRAAQPAPVVPAPARLPDLLGVND